ncbi:MAG: ATP-binding protein [Oscillospiraceae bacterium]|nr:ATP-binding protein [Oscillospiraceae bacterium]
MAELTLDAKVENLDRVLELVNQVLEDANCSFRAQMQVDVAVEEMYVNIAHYAYPSGAGQATVRIEVLPDAVEISLIDSGLPFDPLKKVDPDVTLSAEQRQIGGLGIYMAKKNMDEIEYRYQDGKNILVMRKKV